MWGNPTLFTEDFTYQARSYIEALSNSTDIFILCIDFSSLTSENIKELQKIYHEIFLKNIFLIAKKADIPLKIIFSGTKADLCEDGLQEKTDLFRQFIQSISPLLSEKNISPPHSCIAFFDYNEQLKYEEKVQNKDNHNWYLSLNKAITVCCEEINTAQCEKEAEKEKLKAEEEKKTLLNF